MYCIAAKECLSHSIRKCEQWSSQMVDLKERARCLFRKISVEYPKTVRVPNHRTIGQRLKIDKSSLTTEQFSQEKTEQTYKLGQNYAICLGAVLASAPSNDNRDKRVARNTYPIPIRHQTGKGACQTLIASKDRQRSYLSPAL